MKAINTKYKGYNFRSRTEARWAVYFDAIGLEWEYEKEGFVLDDDTYYLPDFYIEGFGWVEIKGKTPSYNEIKKIKLLSKGLYNEGKKEKTAILIGTPHLKTNAAYFNGEEVSGIIWCSYSVRKWGSTPFCSYVDVGETPESVLSANDYLAIEKAKSMRFEFGK